MAAHVTRSGDLATPIDTAFLRAQTFGNGELEAELLVLFIEQASSLRLMLLNAERVSSKSGLPGDLHRLKGSARAIGAGPLASALDDAEQMLPSIQADEGGPSSSALQALREALDDACSFAASLLPANRRAGLAKRLESR